VIISAFRIVLALLIYKPSWS